MKSKDLQTVESFTSRICDYSIRYNKKFHKYYKDNYTGDQLKCKLRLHAIYYYLISIKNDLKANKVKLKSLHEELTYTGFGIPESYEHFSRILKKMQQPGESIESNLNHASKGSDRGSRFCNELKEYAEVKYKENPLWKYPKLTKEVNDYAVKIGLSTIKIDHIKKYFRNLEIQKRLRSARDEDYFNDNMRHQIHLETPQNAGRQLEIDGTRLQLPFLDSVSKDISFLVLFCILDITSYKVLGYALGQSESSNTVVNAFLRFFNNYNFLPCQITRDNSSAYLRHFKFIESYTAKKGVEWVHTSDPRGCAHISNFQNTFAQSICSSIESYIGLGIRTKDIDSRLNAKQLKKRISDHKELLPNEEELMLQVDKLIIEHGSYNYQQKSSANEVFDAKFDINKVIKLTDEDRALLTKKRKTKKIIKSEIEIEYERKSYFYKLSYAVSEKHDSVIVAYDTADLSTIMIYDHKYNFLAQLSLDESIPSLKSDRSDKQQQQLIKSIKARKQQYELYKKDILDKKQRAFERLDKIIPLYDYNADKSKEEQITRQNQYTRKLIKDTKESESVEHDLSNSNDPFFEVDFKPIKKSN